MPFASSYSRKPDLSEALEEVCQAARAGLGGDSPDLCFLFVSHDHVDKFDELPGKVVEQTGAKHLIGCTGETVVGGIEEIENGPAVSLWCARLPETSLEPFHLEFEKTADGVVCSGFPSFSEENREAVRAVFLLGEPMSSAPNSVIQRLSEELPGVPLMGGMASGGSGPGENRVFLDGESLQSGAVGVVVRGGPGVRSIVSQGCRPIGTTFLVTKAEENVVYELGGKPPLKQLKEFFPDLPERDQMLVQKGLHLGIVMNEYQDKFERGDFLISNVIGADPKQGAIALGNRIRVGQTVQFHVRDAETADEDLRELLERDRNEHSAEPRGALLFSCNGRGTHLFSEPNHDAEAIHDEWSEIPLAGFFAQGELGPVGDKNYLHGFTASIALFE